MGIWEFIGSTAESVRRNAPDATPVKNACITSYTYGRSAVTKVDQTVRINGLCKLGQWMPDDETKSKIVTYSGKFAKNAGIYALQEGYKLIPGGVAFSNILTKTLNDVKHENHKLEKLDLSEKKADVGGGGGRKLIAGAEMHGGGGGESVSTMSATDHKKAEDVIRIFMMKEFVGTRFFDDLMVLELVKGKGKKKPE